MLSIFEASAQDGAAEPPAISENDMRVRSFFLRKNWKEKEP